MGNLGAFEILVIAVVIILLFGTRRLGELGTGMGEAISNFKKAYRDGNAIDVTPDKKSLDETRARAVHTPTPTDSKSEQIRTEDK